MVIELVWLIKGNRNERRSRKERKKKKNRIKRRIVNVKKKKICNERQQTPFYTMKIIEHCLLTKIHKNIFILICIQYIVYLNEIMLIHGDKRNKDKLV